MNNSELAPIHAQINKLKYELDVLRTVMFAVVQTHPDPDALAIGLDKIFEQVISTALPSPVVSEAKLGAMPQSKQFWLDVIAAARKPG